MLSHRNIWVDREPIDESAEEEKSAEEIGEYMARRSRQGTVGGDGISATIRHWKR
jgi:hypothetical protein